MLHDFCLDFVSVGKIDRYSSEFKNQNEKVKRYCVMYIGQKKNFWVVDLKRFAQGLGTREQGLENTDEIIKLHIDDLKEYVDKLWDEWFVDEMVAEGKEMMDSIFGEWEYEMYSFDNRCELQVHESVKLLEPNYMIEPNID